MSRIRLQAERDERVTLVRHAVPQPRGNEWRDCDGRVEALYKLLLGEGNEVVLGVAHELLKDVGQIPVLKTAQTHDDQARVVRAVAAVQKERVVGGVDHARKQRGHETRRVRKGVVVLVHMVPHVLDALGVAVLDEIVRGPRVVRQQRDYGSQLETAHETHVFEGRMAAAKQRVLDLAEAERWDERRQGGVAKGNRLRHLCGRAVCWAGRGCARSYSGGCVQGGRTVRR